MPRVSKSTNVSLTFNPILNPIYPVVLNFPQHPDQSRKKSYTKEPKRNFPLEILPRTPKIPHCSLSEPAICCNCKQGQRSGVVRKRLVPAHVAQPCRAGIWLDGIRLQEASYLPFLLECHLQPSGFLVTCYREAEERGGTAPGDEGVLREERDRAGPEARAEEQWSSSGLAAERSERASKAAEEMREHVDLFDATDVAVAAATCPDDATLLLGIVPRTGQA